MALGPMRHLLEVTKQREGEDDFSPGDSRDDRVCRIRAAIEPLSGNELAIAQQVVANVTHRIRARWNAAVRPEMWLVRSDGAKYHIRSAINVDERNASLEILAIESTAPID